jgi:hypothetical protein
LSAGSLVLALHRAVRKALDLDVNPFAIIEALEDAKRGVRL